MSSILLVTGSCGLIGSEAARFFHCQGYHVVGIDNDMRSYFFGESASTRPMRQRLESELEHCRHFDLDVRDMEGLRSVFAQCAGDIAGVIHTAAQPSHDWAAREPLTDFGINATGTLNLLELTRQYCPDAVFIFTSTNKVYGDTPNRLPLVEIESRWEVDLSHPYAEHGIDESMSIDATLHSLFGASKVAADVLTQEYGRYFGLKTGVFRGGCLTGPAHAGAELHGFLSYLVKCALEGRPYTIYGYKGKQVRDNIHSHDLVRAFWAFFQKPRPGEVYNMGGGRHANVSVIEAIELVQEMSGKKLNYRVSDTSRRGDHIWYVSDVRKFASHYPDWSYAYDIDSTLREMVEVYQDSARVTMSATKASARA